MGGEYFSILVDKTEFITTAKEAFAWARQDAEYWHGHGGYTGTIAEKPSFVQRNDNRPVPLKFVKDWARKDGDDNEKWGDAYMVEVSESENDSKIIGWLFYGWASC